MAEPAPQFDVPEELKNHPLQDDYLEYMEMGMPKAAEAIRLKAIREPEGKGIQKSATDVRYNPFAPMEAKQAETVIRQEKRKRALEEGKVPPVLDAKDIQAVVGEGKTYTAAEIAKMSDEEKAIYQEETQKDYSRGPYATEEDLTAGSFGDPALESTRRGLMFDMDEKQQKQFQTIWTYLMEEEKIPAKEAMYSARSRLRLINEAQYTAPYPMEKVGVGPSGPRVESFGAGYQEPTLGEAFGRQTLQTPTEFKYQQSRSQRADKERQAMELAFLTEAEAIREQIYGETGGENFREDEIKRLRKDWLERGLTAEMVRMSGVILQAQVQADFDQGFTKEMFAEKYNLDLTDPEVDAQLDDLMERKQVMYPDVVNGKPVIKLNRAFLGYKGKLASSLEKDYHDNVYPPKVKKFLDPTLPDMDSVETFGQGMMRHMFTERNPDGSLVETNTAVVLRGFGGLIRPITEGITQLTTYDVYVDKDGIERPVDPDDMNYGGIIGTPIRRTADSTGQRTDLSKEALKRGYYVSTLEGIQKGRFLGEDFMDQPFLVDFMGSEENAWILGFGIEVLLPATPVGVIEKGGKATRLTGAALKGTGKPVAKQLGVVMETGGSVVEKGTKPIRGAAAVSERYRALRATQEVAEIKQSKGATLGKAFVDELAPPGYVKAETVMAREAAEARVKNRTKDIEERVDVMPREKADIILRDLDDIVSDAVSVSKYVPASADELANIKGVATKQAVKMMDEDALNLQSAINLGAVRAARRAKKYDIDAPLPPDRSGAIGPGLKADSIFGQRVIDGATRAMAKATGDSAEMLAEGFKVGPQKYLDAVLEVAGKEDEFAKALQAEVMAGRLEDLFARLNPDGYVFITPTMMAKANDAERILYGEGGYIPFMATSRTGKFMGKKAKPGSVNRIMRDGIKVDVDAETGLYTISRGAAKEAVEIGPLNEAIMRGIPVFNKSMFRGLVSKASANALTGLTEKEMLQAMTFIKNDLVRKQAGIAPMSMTDEAFTKANIPLERRLVSQDLKAVYRFVNESDFIRAIQSTDIYKSIRDFVVPKKFKLSDVSELPVPVRQMMGSLGEEINNLPRSFSDKIRNLDEVYGGDGKKTVSQLLRESRASREETQVQYFTRLVKKFFGDDASPLSNAQIQRVVQKYMANIAEDSNYVDDFIGVVQATREAYPKLKGAGFGGKFINKDDFTSFLMIEAADGYKRGLIAGKFNQFAEAYPALIIRAGDPKVGQHYRGLLDSLFHEASTLGKTPSEFFTKVIKGEVGLTGYLHYYTTAKLSDRIAGMSSQAVKQKFNTIMDEWFTTGKLTWKEMDENAGLADPVVGAAIDKIGTRGVAQDFIKHLTDQIGTDKMFDAISKEFGIARSKITYKEAVDEVNNYIKLVQSKVNSVAVEQIGFPPQQVLDMLRVNNIPVKNWGDIKPDLDFFKPRLLDLGQNRYLFGTAFDENVLQQLRTATAGGELDDAIRFYNTKAQSVGDYVFNRLNYFVNVGSNGIKGGLLGGTLAPNGRYHGVNVFTAWAITAITAPSYAARVLINTPKIALQQIGLAAERVGVGQATTAAALTGTFFGFMADAATGMGVSVGVLLAQNLPRILRRLRGESYASRLPFVKGNDIAYTSIDGIPYTRLQIEDMLVRINIYKSQATYEFGIQMIEDLKRQARFKYVGGKTFGVGEKGRNTIEQMADGLFNQINMFQGKSFWNIVAEESDNAFRTQVFIDAILLGVPEEQAAILARNALLDYGGISKAEKQFVSPLFLFYAFTRNMTMEATTAFLRSDPQAARNLVSQIRATQSYNAKEKIDILEQLADRNMLRMWGEFGKSYDDYHTIHYGPASPAMEGFYNLIKTTELGMDLLGWRPMGDGMEDPIGLSPEMARQFKEKFIFGSNPLAALYFKKGERGVSGDEPQGRLTAREAIWWEQSGYLDWAMDMFDLEPIPAEKMVPGEPTFGGKQYRFASRQGAANYRLYKAGVMTIGLERNLVDWATTTAMVYGLQDAELKRFSPDENAWYLYAVGLDTPMKAPNYLQLQDQLIRRMEADVKAIKK